MSDIEADRVMRVLAIGRRRRVLASIGAEPVSASQLARLLRVALKRTSDDVRALYEAGLIEETHRHVGAKTVARYYRRAALHREAVDALLAACAQIAGEGM